MSAYVPEIISAVVGLIAAWRVPTLRRRVHDHTKLLAELPLELQGPSRGYSARSWPHWSVEIAGA